MERDADQLSAAAREAKERRNRQKSLDRSRRNTNPDQYQLSRAQKREQKRRKDAGLSDRRFVPAGPRKTRKDDEPVQAYRHDRLSRSYRKGRAGAAEESTGLVRTRRDRARAVAADLVATHGPDLVVEDCNLTAWACQWGRSLHAFAPGTLPAALDREATATAEQRNTDGGVRRASTRTTALSQHCLCGHRAAKTLGQRTHRCPRCGLEGDRDAVSATLAAFVNVDPDKPATATLDHTAARQGLQHPTMWATRPDHPTHQGPARRPVRANRKPTPAPP